MVKNRFYRGKENQVAAVEDFVRIVVPLSLGYVEDGNLVCGYHGLVMGCDGKTVSMPAQRVNGFLATKHMQLLKSSALFGYGQVKRL